MVLKERKNPFWLNQAENEASTNPALHDRGTKRFQSHGREWAEPRFASIGCTVAAWFGYEHSQFHLSA